MRMPLLKLTFRFSAVFWQSGGSCIREADQEHEDKDMELQFW